MATEEWDLTHSCYSISGSPSRHFQIAVTDTLLQDIVHIMHTYITTGWLHMLHATMHHVHSLQPSLQAEWHIPAQRSHHHP